MTITAVSGQQSNLHERALAQFREADLLSTSLLPTEYVTSVDLFIRYYIQHVAIAVREGYVDGYYMSPLDCRVSFISGPQLHLQLCLKKSIPTWICTNVYISARAHIFTRQPLLLPLRNCICYYLSSSQCVGFCPGINQCFQSICALPLNL